MAVYVPLHPVPLQFMDGNGDPLSSGTLEFYLSGTTTPANLYSDSIGTSIGSSITLNSNGYPESGGNVITLFRDTSVDYKIVGKNASDVTIWTADTLVTLLDVLASTANGEGASLVSIEDTAGNFTATDVEGALAEIYSDLESNSNGLGASLVGIEDSDGNFTATDVEAALAESGRPATTSLTGVVELAAVSELIIGTSSSLVVTPDALHSMFFAIRIDNDGSPTVLSSNAGASTWTVAADTLGQIEVTHNLGLANINQMIITATASYEAAANTTGGSGLNAEIQSETVNGFTVAVYQVDGTRVETGAVNIIAFRVG